MSDRIPAKYIKLPSLTVSREVKDKTSCLIEKTEIGDIGLFSNDIFVH